MASVSGVQVDLEAMKLGEKLNRHNCQQLWATFKIQDERLVVVDKVAPETAGVKGTQEQFDAFVKSALLDSKEPVYALFRFGYESTTDKVMREQQVFIRYVPQCSVKQKMMATMFSKVVHMKLDGSAQCIQANSEADLTYENVLEHVVAKKTVK